MILDIVFGIGLLIAFIRGWQKGVLWTVLQVLAVFIALPLSLKLTNSVSDFFINNLGVESRFTFLLTFIALFILCMLLFRMVVKLVEGSLDALMMGWANRLAGAVLYGFMLTLFFSTLIWIGNQSSIVKSETASTSKTYPFIEPLAPAVIAWGSEHAPVLGNIYKETQSFLQQINEGIEKIPVS
jgi:membrane protein required for colicin V production